ncbi:MAG: helix-turn-helix transcriptional regulator [Pararhodobacter sp.]|nr:helix-turn-helix transcriptional regulator [Pararhodobacter sp.]
MQQSGLSNRTGAAPAMADAAVAADAAASVTARMRAAWSVPVLWEFTGPEGICGQHWACSEDGEHQLGADIPEDYLIFSLHTAQIDAAEVRLQHRRRFSGALAPGSWMLVSAQGAPEAVTRGAFSLVHLYLPLGHLAQVAEDYALPFEPLSGGRCLHGQHRDNPMAAHAAALARAMRTETPLRALQVDTLCRQLVADYFSQTRPGVPLAGPERLSSVARARVDAFLDAALQEGCTLDQLAAEAGLSKAHFLRAFKGSFGRTPMRALQERRLIAARHLIRQTRLSLADIAARCGYADQSHMSRAFRAGLGMTPAAWRRGGD